MPLLKKTGLPLSLFQIFVSHFAREKRFHSRVMRQKRKTAEVNKKILCEVREINSAFAYLVYNLQRPGKIVF